jgi:hypothetical protein
VDHGGGIYEKRTRRYMGGGESAIVLDRRMAARSRGRGGGGGLLLIAGCDVDESADRSPIGGLLVGSLLLSDSPIGGYIGGSLMHRRLFGAACSHKIWRKGVTEYGVTLKRSASRFAPLLFM